MSDDELQIIEKGMYHSFFIPYVKDRDVDEYMYNHPILYSYIIDCNECNMFTYSTYSKPGVDQVDSLFINYSYDCFTHENFDEEKNGFNMYYDPYHAKIKPGMRDISVKEILQSKKKLPLYVFKNIMTFFEYSFGDYGDNLLLITREDEEWDQWKYIDNINKKQTFGEKGTRIEIRTKTS
jgi:hypothetical protein